MYQETFWKWTAILFILISICAVLLALRCSQPLICVNQYERDGTHYCVSEIKE